jgi:hypothetical protein
MNGCTAESSFACVLVYETVFCFLSRACMVRHRKCSLRLFPLALGTMFSTPRNILKASVVRHSSSVCASMASSKFTARTARCSFLLARLRWTSSTHTTPCIWPPGMCVCVCVCALSELVLQLNRQFWTKQIKSPLPESAKILECETFLSPQPQGGCCV